MTNTAIIGLGKTAVGEHWNTSLRHLAWYAIEQALDTAGTNDIDAIFVGNMLGSTINSQDHLGALVADFSGLRGAEAVTVEAAEASGGAAVRQAIMAVKSGMVQTALVVGVEKITDKIGNAIPTAIATGMDSEYELPHGMTMESGAALLMQRYMHEYNVPIESFANFSVNAHANGGKNAGAMFRNRLKAERFGSAPQVASPVSLFDAAPPADGAAAVIITSKERAGDMVPQPIQIRGSAMATDTMAIHDRKEMLWLNAVARSTQLAFEQAGISKEDVDVAELHDSYTIMTTLALEAMGFAERGAGWSLAEAGAIMADGSLPISTFGGLKARGNPVGATGVYQIVEVAQQLLGTAEDCQIPDVSVGLAQNIGGNGGTAVTHILTR